MSQKNKLFVGGLSQNVTQDSLFETFDKYGKIEDGELRRDYCLCLFINVVNLAVFRYCCDRSLKFLHWFYVLCRGRFVNFPVSVWAVSLGMCSSKKHKKPSHCREVMVKFWGLIYLIHIYHEVMITNKSASNQTKN